MLLLSIFPAAVLAALFFLLLGRSAALLAGPGDPPDWRPAFLAAGLLWGALAALSSEALSLFTALTPLGVSLFWGLALLLLLGLGFSTRLFQAGWRSLAGQFHASQPWSRGELLLLLGMALLLAGVGVVAWMAPPNTNDVLAYHMARVMHWIQDRSLAHYATPIDRQLWMPPFAEMAILHLQLLAGSDRLANLVQAASLVGCLAGVSYLARLLGGRRKAQLLAALFCLTLTNGLLQATATKNDFVAALWALCAAVWTVQASRRRLTRFEWVCLSLAVGLGLLTKGTFLAFVLPWMAWLLVSCVRRLRWTEIAAYAALGAGVVLALNAGHWLRNQATYGLFVGDAEMVRFHSNADYRPGVLAANVLLNSALNLGVPLANGLNTRLDAALLSLVHRLGAVPNEDLHITSLWRSEDYAGNPLHFGLIGLSAAALFWPRRGRRWGAMQAAALAVLAGFVLFSALYKPQSVGGRLQLSFFVLWAPLAGAWLAGWKWPPLRWAAAAALLVAGAVVLVFNQARPLAHWGGGNPTVFEQSRLEALFANSRWAQAGFVAASRAVQASGCRRVGLKIDSHEPEYPFWVLLSPTGREIHLEHIDQSPPEAQYEPAGFRPCAVICTTMCGAASQVDGLLFARNYDFIRLYLAPEYLPALPAGP